MKILLVQHRQVGDVLMCTPALRALRRAFPRADITFLVEPFSLPAVRWNPRVNRFIVPPRRLGFRDFLSLHVRVRRERYDVVIDFFKNPKSAWLTWFSGAERRISFTGRYRNFAYNILVDMGDRRKDYAAVQKLRLLRPLGITEEKDCLPEFFVPPEDERWAEETLERLGVSPRDLLVAVSPVSRRPARRWPPAYYARLCDHLVSRWNAKVLLTWGPGEKDTVAAVAAAMHHAPLVDYPMPSLTQLAALFGKCSLFIGNDTGPRHMAVAVGVPTLGLFGPTPPSCWTPPDNPMFVSLRADPTREGLGQPVYKMENLPPDRVIRAADEIVSSLPGG